jgi:malonyl-CoA/methylmalonyl-CoA synthetase
MNLPDLFAIAARREPEKAALRWSAPATADVREPFQELSYAGLDTAADRLAAALAGRGLARGDRLALYLPNGPELAVAHLAALRLGAIALPINLAYRRREIGPMLADAEPRLLLADPAILPILDELSPRERASLEGVISAAEVLGLEAAPALAAARPALAPSSPVTGDDPALLLYTSGTTGPSRGAVISHNNLLATVTGLLAAWAWRPEDVLLLCLPLFHVHGLVVGLDCGLAAGATVHLARFAAAAVVDTLAAGGATLFFGVPTLYVRLVEELRQRRCRGAAADLSRVRLFCSGSAPLAPETFAAFRDLTGHEILERYGMTEAGMILSNPYLGPRRPGTVGTPLPGVSARIVGEAGEDLPPGADGELWVRGGNVFSGYFRAPEKTAASFRHDALGRRWFQTGDLARQDPQTGAISLLGRRSELILCGGFNVYPREVEESLLAFPGIREAAVAGRPHPEWGEVPVAYLVLERPVDRAELEAHLRRDLAAFKIPRAFRTVEALPRNALGKIQKHLLAVGGESDIL